MDMKISFESSYHDACYACIDSLSQVEVNGQFRNSEEYLQAVLKDGADAGYNGLKAEEQKKVRETLWNYYTNPFVKKILEAIKPGYYASEKTGGHQSPRQALEEDGSRYFDNLKVPNLMTEEQHFQLLQDFILYGEEYFLSKFLNPIVQKVFDSKGHLNKSFIDNHLGQAAYEKLKEKYPNNESEIAFVIFKAFKVYSKGLLLDSNNYEKSDALGFYTRKFNALNSKYEQITASLTEVKRYSAKKYNFCKQMKQDILEFSKEMPKKFDHQSFNGLEEIFNVDPNDYGDKPIFKGLTQNIIIPHLYFVAILEGLSKLNPQDPEESELIAKGSQILEKYELSDPKLVKERQTLAEQIQLNVFQPQQELLKQKSRSRGLATLILAVLAFTTFLALGLYSREIFRHLAH